MSDLISLVTENQKMAFAVVTILALLLFPKYRPYLVKFGLIKVDADGKLLPIELEAAPKSEKLVKPVVQAAELAEFHEANGNPEGAAAARKSGAELFTATKPEAGGKG